MKTRFAVLATVAAFAVAGALSAQTPRGSAVATVDGKTVSVDYGRPALKGRDLETLLKDLPADRVWRAGENQVTTFTTGAPLLVGGKAVPAGKYSLYVKAGEKGGGWALILNRDLGVPLGKIWDKAPDNMKNEPWPNLAGGYSPIGDKEVMRVEMKPATAEPSDLFTISFVPKGKGADMTLAWGKEAWSIDVQPGR
jgi:hypothetical protein